MTLPDGTRGRLLAVTLALLLLAAIAAGIAVPVYLLHQRYDDVRSSAEERIDRYRRVAALRGEYQRALDVIKARESGRFFLKSPAPTLAGAELTDLVRPLLEANGARLTSIQPTTVKDDAGFRLYSLNIGFNATPAALQKTLYALETGLPYLFIDNITLRATVPRGFKPAPNQEPEVSAQIEVQAYGPKDPAKSARPPTAPGPLPGGKS
jgi:general secretion pathway protein M